MKVFLSWSGDLSREVACVFRDWLPSVLQCVKPYVSSEDIDKGARWSTDIALELEASSFGIICVTGDNIDAPWINFEAGALSKMMDKSRVSPFLLNLKRSEVQGPLLQFQSTIYDKEDIQKLVSSINNCMDDDARLDDDRMKRTFDAWWPDLERGLEGLRNAAPARKEKEVSHTAAQSAVLEELLELARSQQKLLRSPEVLLPPGYLAQVLTELPQRARVLIDDNSISRFVGAQRPGPTPPLDPGDKVRHLKLGVGTVVSCVPNGADFEVAVAFEGAGVKRFLLSFAPLEKI